MLGIYCRISRLKEEGKNFSIPDQKAKGIDKAKELNLDFKIYIDEGISGSSDIDTRPGFASLMKDIKNGKITHIFAVDQSRLERNPQVRFIINNIFKEYDLQFYTEFDGYVDLHDSQSEFIGDMLSIINKHHITVSTRKSKDALRRRVEQGKAHPYILPYGYTKDKDNYLIIDDEEALVVKDIFKSSLSGLGTNSIANKLNREGIKTRYAKLGQGSVKIRNKYTKEITTREKKDTLWAGNTIRNIIKNSIYYGDRLYKDIIYPAPAILEKGFWQKVNENLPNNRNNSGKKVQHKYLLKGLLRCGRCGRNYYGRINKTDNYYQCSSKRISSCGNRSINITNFEGLIWNNLIINRNLKELLDNKLNAGGDVDNLKQLEVSKNKLHDHVKKLYLKRTRELDYGSDGLISREEVVERVKKVDKEVESTQNEIIHLEKELEIIKRREEVSNNYLSKFEDLKVDATFSQKKELVNDLIKNIIIDFNDDKKEYNLKIELNLGSTDFEKQSLELISLRPQLISDDEVYVDNERKLLATEMKIRLKNNKWIPSIKNVKKNSGWKLSYDTVTTNKANSEIVW